MKILGVVGARPNFMKIMPLIREFKRYPRRIKYTLVHTGQHYDSNMSLNFFKDLKIPKPDIYLGVGSTTHGVQTARVIEGIEKILQKERFDLIIVVGDVNSTVASALAAVKLGVKVAHVEAGLRSFDRSMPEEINRILTDHISDYLFTTEESGNKNLLREGIPPSKIFFVGDIMIDSYRMNKNKISKSRILEKLELKKKGFCLVTIHRPSNVDREENLKKMVDILQEISKRIKVVFPAHPRTKKMIKRFRLDNRFSTDNGKGIMFIEPLGYIDFQNLMLNSKFVMTDSGGIQEEATVKNVPCLTLRTTTERPITIKQGSNELTGPDKTGIRRAVDRIIKEEWKKARRPPLWDGRTAQRIVKVLLKREKYICTH